MPNSPLSDAPISDSAIHWYYAQDGKAVGPLSLSSIRALKNAGQLAQDTMIAREGSEDWQPLSTVIVDDVLPRTQEKITGDELSQKPRKWYHHPVVVILMLLGFYPVGLILLLSANLFSRPMRLAIALATGMIFASTFLGNTKARFKSVSEESTYNASTSRERGSNAVPSSITWDEVDQIYSLGSKYSDLQKEENWKRFQGKTVEWKGEVAEVTSGTFTGLKLQVKMNPQTFTSDVIVELKDSERNAASKLHKGQPVVFKAKLERWGSLLPISATDGVIVKP